MALEKSPPPPKPASSALNAAARDGHCSSISSFSADERYLSSKCFAYAVRGNEAWISCQDMDNLKHVTGGNGLAKNSDLCDRGFKVLPKGCKLGKFVGEGAANAVFEFHLPDGSHLYHQNTRLLLRVAKKPVQDDRPKFNYIEQERYYRTRIRPILGPHVLHQELVIIRNSGIIDAVNGYLTRNDKKRKPKFMGTTIDQSDWGFLVEDMRPDDENDLLVEFKPKWLSQSPSAPKNAIRCRQCAKELHGYVMEPDLERPTPTMAKPCPLTLGRDDGNRVRTESAHRLLPLLDTLENSEHLSATLDVLRDEAAFKQLRSAQEENDRVGPLNADKSDANFSLAMTLRDCTCFAQVSRRANRSRDSVQPLKIRFGDFDMKSPRFRLDYWRGVEEELIRGGFYTADWLYYAGSYYRPPTKCVLELSNTRRQGLPEVTHIHDIGANTKTTIGSPAVYQGRKIYNVNTDAVNLQKCLEAHKTAAPGPTVDEEKRLKIRSNSVK